MTEPPTQSPSPSRLSQTAVAPALDGNDFACPQCSIPMDGQASRNEEDGRPYVRWSCPSCGHTTRPEVIDFGDAAELVSSRRLDSQSLAIRSLHCRVGRIVYEDGTPLGEVRMIGTLTPAQLSTMMLHGKARIRLDEG